MPDVTATYRLQLQPGFGFAQVAAVVPYLSALGISHVYASPVFRARPGSRHGYDGLDPNSLNPELGSAADWQALRDRLRAHGLGWLQDIVPNHLAYHADNPMLADVLAHGPSALHADTFDICWGHPSPHLRGRLMAPFLDAPYSACLARGDIRLAMGPEGLCARYADLRFPLAPETWREVLEPGSDDLRAALGAASAAWQRWFDALDRLENLPLVADPTARREEERVIQAMLWDLHERHPAVRDHVGAALELCHGAAARREGFPRLDRLLARQRFRLCHWQTAAEEINYRRFFDINHLIALRQENPAVFGRTHRLLGEWAAAGFLDGVRVDHVDGLADPRAYLVRLRELLGPAAYIAVEKILAPDEELPAAWPVQGTTGYDFAHGVNGIFVDGRREAAFTAVHEAFSGRRTPFPEVAREARREVLARRLAGDLDNLARRAREAAARKPRADHLAETRLREALGELLVRLPVYRTYLGSGAQDPEGRALLETLLKRSRQARPDLAAGFDLLQRLFLGRRPSRAPGDETPPAREDRRIVQGFEQLAAALAAKGVEDTAFYRCHRLLSLNEVGGDPERFGSGRAPFHAFLQRRAERSPRALNATATHDAKRGEDVRARLNVLSELPAEWGARLEAWHATNRERRIPLPEGPVPDRNVEVLLYQTLVGAFPAAGPVTPQFVERIQAYLVKATREAGGRTSWAAPRGDYEEALTTFVARILETSPANAFLADLKRFAARVAFWGLLNTLSQTVLKIAAPGVPDFYQGTELLQLALVDPDNRAPVDFAARRRLLATLGPEADPRALAAELRSRRNDDRLKLFVTARGLAIRRRHPALFVGGAYHPLEARGPQRRHVVAFAREAAGLWCLTVVPRLVASLTGTLRNPVGRAVWGETVLRLPPRAPRAWRAVYSHQVAAAGTELAVAEALAHLPVALLLGES